MTIKTSEPLSPLERLNRSQPEIRETFLETTSYTPELSQSQIQRKGLNQSQDGQSRSEPRVSIRQKRSIIETSARTSLGSPLERSVLHRSSTDQRSPLQKSLYPVSSPSTQTPPRYFGIRPVEVRVNRSVERNIDNPKQFVFSSPTTSSPAVSPLIEDTQTISFTEVNVRSKEKINMYKRKYSKGKGNY